ncbi:AraC family transcriptional regulator [Tengunoibacter tsumagoiensis]|uniref:AraC family transcriptional regulator n=1 Tax=Tengunoibacter tsumagoiensis TaxID=2014871 RepID=A0A402A8N6_9CHLR|nr:AraC family transcriptional regulator [Tengunoibacter tsumagoiensis]GCE15520.1 AraC family transcriptional regulator [Tengunoibacter tsumagoiensis]
MPTAERQPVSQNGLLHSNGQKALVAPVLYLSSEQAGWEGVRAEAFHEPDEFEGWNAEPRANADIALILFRGGGMRLEQRCSDGPWRGGKVQQGDLLLRAEGEEPYEVRWKSFSEQPTRTLHVHLKQELLRRVSEEVADYDGAKVSLRSRPGFQDPLLSQIGFALWQELEEPSSAGKLYAQTAAQMLAVHLLRRYAAVGKGWEESGRGLTRPQMQRVADFVQAHLEQEISLEELAGQAGFSIYHFARLFRETTGESPHQFVVRQRIERAQTLLKKGEMALAQVALEVGFANQSHLTRVFKRQVGVTPRAYRQEWRD